MESRMRIGILIIVLLLALLIGYEGWSSYQRTQQVKEAHAKGLVYKAPETIPIREQTPTWQVPLFVLINYLAKAWVCLSVAFLIAGAIDFFIPKETIMKYLRARGPTPYLGGAFGGPLLSVCSCSIIPIFAGLYNRGAGLGPALAFLLAAPAINIAAVLLTVSLISWKIAVGRIILAFGAALIVSYLVGGIIFGKSRSNDNLPDLSLGIALEGAPLWEDLIGWMQSSWGFVRMILPLVLLGTFFIGIFRAFVPPETIGKYLGQGTLQTMLASIMGVVMYTPTLVEVPFVRALLEMGMGTGPALAFLLTGPALSLPSMLGVGRVVSWKIVLSYAFFMWIVGTLGGLIFAFFIPKVLLV